MTVLKWTMRLLAAYIILPAFAWEDGDDGLVLLQKNARVLAGESWPWQRKPSAILKENSNASETNASEGLPFPWPPVEPEPTPAPTPIVFQKDAAGAFQISDAETRAMLAKKLGVNCNTGVNAEALWVGPYIKDVEEVCEALYATPRTEKVLLHRCQAMCAEYAGNCTTIEFKGKPKKTGICVLLKCSEHEIKEIESEDEATDNEREEERTQHWGYVEEVSPNAHVLEPWTNISSWFWTYGLVPSAGSLRWAQKNNKEFVALINLKKAIPKENGTCTWELDMPDTCKVETLVALLKETQQKITVKYLLGYNEPYAGHGASDDISAGLDDGDPMDADYEQEKEEEAEAGAAAHGGKGGKGTQRNEATKETYGLKAEKHVTPREGAEIWRRIVQPTAEQTGLKLVSPTTGISAQKTQWLIEFLQACYDKREDTEFPCDVKKVGTWSIHEYKCMASYWRKYAAPDGGDDVLDGNPSCGRLRVENQVNMYTRFKQAMLDKYGKEEAEEFWYPYINGVKLWITETSCGGANKYDKDAKKSTGIVAPSAVEQCEFITGQSCHRQEGSIKAFLGMPNIERFSWFTLLPHPPPEHINYDAITKGAMINYITSYPTPIGRAFLASLNASKTDCSGDDGPWRQLAASAAEEPPHKRKKLLDRITRIFGWARR